MASAVHRPSISYVQVGVEVRFCYGFLQKQSFLNNCFIVFSIMGLISNLKSMLENTLLIQFKKRTQPSLNHSVKSFR